MGNQQESLNDLMRIPEMDKYFADSKGNIFSTKRTQVPKKLTPHIHYGNHSIHSYMRIHISNKHFLVHRIIASVHVGRQLYKHEQVNHINGKTDDNRLSNLEVVSHRENVAHAVQNGLYCSGKAWYKARGMLKGQMSSTTIEST